MNSRSRSASFLSFLRLFTAVLALSYSVAYAPEAWRYLLHPNWHLEAMSPREPHALIRAGVIGVYATVFGSLIIAYGTLPRWRHGSSALSWCFLLMAVSLLNHWAIIEAGRYNARFMQASAFAWSFVFALPPLILGILLQLPIVKQSLQLHGFGKMNAPSSNPSSTSTREKRREDDVRSNSQ